MGKSFFVATDKDHSRYQYQLEFELETEPERSPETEFLDFLFWRKLKWKMETGNWTENSER
jgi:hypothetical protein